VDFLFIRGMIRPGNQENPMSKRTRRNHTPAFRAKVALAAALLVLRKKLNALWGDDNGDS